MFKSNLKDCLGGHIGKTVVTWFEEEDDDRYRLMKVARCSHCFIPVGYEDYATREEEEMYYKGERPPQEIPA